jgi:hypothetical protein
MPADRPAVEDAPIPDGVDVGRAADHLRRWAIHKASRLYGGGTYDGPSIDRAGTYAGPYATWDEAQEVRERLEAVNPVGWVIVTYRPRGGH